LTALRRGALLHDIGKIGVPDGILHKPGPLTAEEWVLMRLHPVHARQMLEPIGFLRPSLDIPYCHHEKWDGTGYPNGLAGGQIPLAARVFAVVDVWDALRSARPYHAAWTERDALKYVREQAGKHFDPEVAGLFLRLDRETPRGAGAEADVVMATVLIVDDRSANREFLTTLLGYGGHRLLEAADGAEGLAVAGPSARTWSSPTS